MTSKMPSNPLKNSSATENFYTPNHNYNTRLSAKSSNSLLTKKLFVNLNKVRSASKVRQLEICSSSPEIDSSRNSDTFPTELDFEAFGFTSTRQQDNFAELYKKYSYYMDWNQNPCGLQIPTSRSYCCIFLKYILALAAVGCLVVPFVMQIQKDINNLTNDVEALKKTVQNIKRHVNAKLSKLEKVLDNSRHEQENVRDEVSHLVEEQLQKLSSDKTGRTDFALESAGGRIMQLTSGTENFGNTKNSIFGISLCEGMHGPKAMIQAGTSLGECWAFKGSSGGAIIRLLGEVNVDAVSIEHISKQVSPTGSVPTAPKEFQVLGMSSLNDRGVHLGEFAYDENGPLIQTFKTIPSKKQVEFVELRVLSNHGHPDFTCIYRFRVHGTLVQFPGGKKI